MKAWCWYTLEDKAKTNAKHEKTVWLGSNPGRRQREDKPIEASTAGWLEGAREFTTTVTRCIDAVMDEQDRQWRTSSDDHDRLAAVSKSVVPANSFLGRWFDSTHKQSHQSSLKRG
jgi:hypothetical protein